MTRPAINPDAIYSREEACELLGLSLSTLKKLLTLGHLRYSQAYRRIWIRGQWILDFMRDTERTLDNRK